MALKWDDLKNKKEKVKMNKSMKLVAVLGLILVLGACHATEKGDKAKASTPVKTHHEAINYDKQEDWEFASGKMQSPINIDSKKVDIMTPDKGEMTLNFGKKITKAENNGHSIQVTDSGQSTINGREFNLTQFHFHAESEHTVDGKHYPLEAHFVNQSQDGRIAVIGVFFKAGRENLGFKEVLADVASKKIDAITDIDKMIPQNKSFYHYLGSLTTPPLTENVEWYLMKAPLEVSQAQLDAFKKLYAHNNRKIQPLNDRKILAHDE
ncbi:hypothetical protein RU86_GL002191 [Lactococcus piscium]|uniref:Carbonic anhydrase n=1 Tax=Pseudolactococcus piscium TaxID=1364 RepID=A0A2A5S0T1_9LACT|nr:carbonic anhydrase family protein [Lactococcus piscium]PCS07079.1 hypothetical protein RU86_GL002191 [Lactococcus piscium]